MTRKKYKKNAEVAGAEKVAISIDIIVISGLLIYCLGMIFGIMLTMH